MRAMNSQNLNFERFNMLRPYWVASLAIWLVAMCLVPDPRPLSVPEWSIRTVQVVLGASEPKARLIAAIVLRTVGVGVIGVLTAMIFHDIAMRRIAVCVVVAAPLLAVGVKWIHFGYFPIRSQLYFIIAAALLGGLAGLAVRRNRIAAIALVALSGLLLVWGTSTRSPEDLEQAARATGLYLLENADEISRGDEAFGQLLQIAFEYAEENSQGSNAVFPNKAAILALGVIMGDDQVVRVGRRAIDPDRKGERESLRRKVTVHSRGDLPRHFAVSAALVVLADQNRSLAVGIAKEVSDSNPGGSGFSFVDMLANKSGIRLAVLATRNNESARTMQRLVIQSSNRFQFIPEIVGLPEGLSSERFESEFGGLGGRKTRELFAEIDRRISESYGLR